MTEARRQVGIIKNSALSLAAFCFASCSGSINGTVTDTSDAFSISITPSSGVTVSAIPAGQCSQFTVTRTVNGVPTAAATSTLVVLSSGSHGNFFSDSGCHTSLVSDTVTLAAGQTSTNVAFQGTSAGSYTLTATSDGASTSGSQDATVVSGSATQLVLSSPGTTASACTPFSTAPTAQYEDAFGNVVTSASTSTTLAAFSDSNCNTPAGGGTSNATVNAASGVASFSQFLYNTTGTVHLKASGGSLNSSCSSAVTLASSGPKALAFSTQPPDAGTAGTALSPSLVVTVKDACNLTVSSATNAVTLTPFEDSNCAVAAGHSLTGASATAASGSATFASTTYPGEGLVFVEASASGLTPACSTGVSLAPGSASHLAIVSGSSQTGGIGLALPAALVVKATDTNGNPVAGTTINYSATGGTVASTATTDGSGSASVTLTPTATSVSVQAYLTGGQSTSGKNVTFTATGQTVGSASKLVLSGQPTMIVPTIADTSGTTISGVCSGQYTVSVTDSNGYLKAPGSSTNITLSASNHGTLYSDSTCTTAISGPVTIGTSSTSSTFYLSDAHLETVALNAAPTAGPLSAASPLSVQVAQSTLTTVDDATKAPAAAVSLPNFAFNNTYVSGYAKDSQGSIHMAGFYWDGYAYHLVTKKSTDDGVTWTTTQDFSDTSAGGGESYQPAGIAIDPEDNIYVTAASPNYATSDMITRKSSDHGTTWTTVSHYSRSGASVQAFGLTANAAGTLYSLGTTNTVSATASTTASLVLSSTDGALTWQVLDIYEIGGLASDTATGGNQNSAITTDSLGNIYYVTTDGSWTSWITRKSADGGATWTLSDDQEIGNGNPLLTGGGAQGPYAVNVDPTTNYVYTSGWATDGNGYNYAITRVSKDLGATWQAFDTYTPGASQYDGTYYNGVFSTWLAVDPSNGTIYVCGQFQDAADNTFMTLRETTNGGASWNMIDMFTLSTPTIDGSTVTVAMTLSLATSVFVPSAGHVLVGGISVDSSLNYAMITRRF